MSRTEKALIVFYVQTQTAWAVAFAQHRETLASLFLMLSVILGTAFLAMRSR